jgi:Fanconi anemia group M protein
MVIILVDHRERRATVSGHLQALGATIVEQHIPTGDYLLSERVGVERKTAFDFVTAIIQKRFYLQLQRLKAAYTHPLYLIEGRQLYGLRNVHPNFIRGALAILTVEYAIPTLFTLGPEDTAELLFLIARREQRGESPSPTGQVMEAVPRGYKKALDLRGQQLQVLEALPLVGRVRARSLLNHFGTIERLAAATERDLAQIPGIGAKTAGQVRQVLSAAFARAESGP